MPTSTSPLRPPVPGRSPTASQSSPRARASASTASNTASSYGRPLAVERACSAATSACFSRSACSLTTSPLSAAICSLSARRFASCCSAARFIAAIVPALKSASGLCASAEENCLSRSSRMRADCSAITSRSWCWTATADSAPNIRSSSLRQLPVLGREHLVDALVEELRDQPRLLRERPLDLARDLLELRPHEVGVDLGLLARQHARADLDRVDEHLGRVGAGLGALAHELDRAAVAHGEAVGDDDVAEDGHAGWAEGRRGFHDGPSHATGAHPTEARSLSGSRTRRALRAPRRRPRAARRPRGRARCGTARRAGRPRSGSPSSTASTVPSERFAAQPATPSRAAARRSVSRKKTPCTRPWARTRLRTVMRVP